MALKIINAEFIKGAVKSEQFPNLGVPEFAFFGRSNTGKSSLINMLVNRKNLVKTGSRPGMTREINFFAINKPANTKNQVSKKNFQFFCLTDLPGYGYAKLPGRMIQNIDQMLYDYCVNRKTLKTLFFLIDLRRTPGAIEKQSLEFFRDLGIKAVVIGTKADKINRTEQNRTLQDWHTFFGNTADCIIPSSSPKKIGKEQILSIIEALCTGQPSQ